MIPRENQSELKRYRDILFATIDYHLEKTAGSIKFDGFDPSAHHLLRLKQQAEKHYQKGRLERLQKILYNQTEMPLYTGDLHFGSYIKEKTGCDIDIFGNIRERTDKIIEQKRIRNKNEYRDVVAMLSLYRQAPADKNNMDILNKLLKDFSDRANRRKSPEPDNYFYNRLSETWSPDNKRKLSVIESGTDKNYAMTAVYLDFEQTSASIYDAKGMNLSIKARWKNSNTIVIETKKNYEVFSKRKQVQIFQDIIKIEHIES